MRKMKPVLVSHQDCAKFKRLIEWMTKSHSADLSKVELGFHEPNYKGVYAKQDIKKGETILFIP